MKSNSEIVNDVARNYKIKELINRMIDYSIKDQSNNDLEQYVYEELLNYDNNKLNKMYIDGTNTKNPNKQSTRLRNFISIIIKNSRKKNHYYQTELRIKSQEYIIDVFDTTQEDEEEFNVKEIISYINRKSNLRDDIYYTSKELDVILSFTILRKYCTTNLTQQQLGDRLNLSRLTIASMMKIAKKDIYNWWFKNN